MLHDEMGPPQNIAHIVQIPLVHLYSSPDARRKKYSRRRWIHKRLLMMIKVIHGTIDPLINWAHSIVLYEREETYRLYTELHQRLILQRGFSCTFYILNPILAILIIKPLECSLMMPVSQGCWWGSLGSSSLLTILQRCGHWNSFNWKKRGERDCDGELLSPNEGVLYLRWHPSPENIEKFQKCVSNKLSFPFLGWRKRRGRASLGG